MTKEMHRALAEAVLGPVGVFRLKLRRGMIDDTDEGLETLGKEILDEVLKVVRRRGPRR